MNFVEVRYFASLRESAGVERERVPFACATYGELYAQLAAQHRFSLPPDLIQVAVNDEFSRLDAPIERGATVVFIPPMAGG